MEFGDLEEKIKELSKWEKAAILVFIFAFGIRLAYYQHGLWIDEGNQLDKARDLIKGDFRITRRPFYYLLLLFSLVISGFSTSGAELLIILMGSGTVFLTFLIGKEIFNEKVGLFSSLLLATQPLHWFLSPRVLSDVPVTFMVALTSYLFLRAQKTGKPKDYYLTAACLGLSVLTKVNGLITIVPIGLFLVIEHRNKPKNLLKKKYLVPLAIVILIVGSWFLATYLSFGDRYFLKTALTRLTQSQAGRAVGANSNPFYYLMNLHSILRLPLAIVFGFGILALVLAKFKNFTYPLLWFVSFLVVSSFLSIKVPRYLLPLIPAVCLIGGFGLDKVRRDLENKKHTLMIIIAILIVVSAFQFRAGSALTQSKAQTYVKLRQAGRWLKAHTTREDKIIAASIGQIRWFSNRDCYSSKAFESKEKFLGLIKNKSIEYIELDSWEVNLRRKERRWIFSYLSEHNNSFIPVKAFGVNKKPVVVIYKVNIG